MNDWEMLVVDDCSPDDTSAVIRQWSLKDPRIIRMGTNRNEGPGNARNLALSVARGRYIAFCDSDDVWLPEKLSSQIAYMSDTRTGFSFTAYKRINHDGSRVGVKQSVPRLMNYRQLLGNTAIVTSTVMIDTRIHKTLQMPSMRCTEDYAFWLSLLRKGHTAHGLDRALTLYRVLESSASSNKFTSMRGVWSVYRNHESLGVAESGYYFLQYAARALKKRIRF